MNLLYLVYLILNCIEPDTDSDNENDSSDDDDDDDDDDDADADGSIESCLSEMIFELIEYLISF